MSHESPQQANQGQASPARGRRRFLLGVVVGAVVVSVAGLFASTLVKSPQQLAAEAAPPERSTITAPVVEQVIRQTLVMRAQVRPGKKVEIAPAGAENAVVTGQPTKKGDRVKSGAIIGEVSGRPIIALEGAFPAYRDIRPGAKGKDVAQLQVALGRLGYRIWDADGVYGSSTQQAVRALYTQRDYDPPLTDPEPDSDDDKDKDKAKPKRKVLVKAAELAFIPRFPATVTKVKAGIGDRLKGALLELSAGGLVAEALLTVADRELVKEGMKGSLLDEESDKTYKVEIDSIGEFGTPDDKNAEGADQGAGHPVIVKGADEGLPQKLADKDLRLTIDAASSDGKVLAVPASAIYAVASGDTEVIVAEAGGRERRVAVDVGVSGEGLTEIKPEDDLEKGDRVVVGRGQDTKTTQREEFGQ